MESRQATQEQTEDPQRNCEGQGCEEEEGVDESLHLGVGHGWCCWTWGFGYVLYTRNCIDPLSYHAIGVIRDNEIEA